MARHSDKLYLARMQVILVKRRWTYICFPLQPAQQYPQAYQQETLQMRPQKKWSTQKNDLKTTFPKVLVLKSRLFHELLPNTQSEIDLLKILWLSQNFHNFTSSWTRECWPTRRAPKKFRNEHLIAGIPNTRDQKRNFAGEKNARTRKKRNKQKISGLMSWQPFEAMHRPKNRHENCRLLRNLI